MTLRLGTPRSCVRCGNHRPHKARGLCNPCYTTAHQTGTKDQWARTYADAQTRHAVIEDYDWLIEAGETPARAAERVGTDLATIRRWQESAA